MVNWAFLWSILTKYVNTLETIKTCMLPNQHPIFPHTCRAILVDSVRVPDSASVFLKALETQQKIHNADKKDTVNFHDK